MPFNSDTYHANKSRKDAWAYLAEAREIKERAARGEAYDWEVARISTLVMIARGNMHRSLMFRREAESKKAMRKMRP
jgi:hypothetical protein